MTKTLTRYFVELLLERYGRKYTGKKPHWQLECELIGFFLAFTALTQAVMNALFMTTQPTFEIYVTSLLSEPTNVATIAFISVPFNLWLMLAAWATCLPIATFLFHFAYITTAFLTEIK